MSRRTISLQPYSPVGGLFTDTPSLTLPDPAALELINFKVDPDGVSTRHAVWDLAKRNVAGEDGYSASHLTYPFTSKPLAIFLYRDPSQKIIPYVFFADDVAQYVEATRLFKSVLNGGVTFSGITHWSVTEITDGTLGSTFVAAGTAPNNAYDAESDAASRVFLYWDRTASPADMKEVTLYEEFEEVARTWHDPDTDASASPYLDLAVPSVLPLKAGSVEVYWNGDTSGTGGADSGNRWTLTDDGVGGLDDQDGNPKGTINYNTGAIQLTGDPTSTTSGGTITFTMGGSGGNQVAGNKVWMKYQAQVNVKPRFVFNMFNRLVMVNEVTHEWSGSAWDSGTYNPWRVRWSEARDVFMVDQASDVIDNAGVDISPYMDGEYLNNDLILYRQNSVEEMFFVGGAQVFGFRTSSNDGTLVMGSAGTYGAMQLYLGKDDVYAFDTAGSEGIGLGRVRDRIFADLDPTELIKVHSIFYRRRNEYWLFIPRSSDTTGYPSRCYCYNVPLKAWSVFDWPEEITCTGIFRELGDTAIDDAIGTIDQQQGSFDDSARLGRYDTPLLGTEDGRILITKPFSSVDFGTTPIDCTLITRDFVFEGTEHLDRTQKVDVECEGAGTGGSLVVQASTNYGRDWKGSQTLTLPAQMDQIPYWIDTVGRRIRFKLTTSDPVEIRFLQLSGIRFNREVHDG